MAQRPLFISGDYLALVQALVRCGELLAVLEHNVAEGALGVPCVLDYIPAVAAVFAEHYRPACRAAGGRGVDGQDIFVYALEFRAALVVPAAGVVDEAGGVVILYRGAYLLGVKLAPASLKGTQQQMETQL